MGKAALDGRFKASASMAAAIVLVLALLVFLSLLAEMHYVRWDLTVGRENTLSPKTVKVLENLKEPVTVKAFVKGGTSESKVAERLLAGYRYLNRLVSFELIDPTRYPTEARRCDVQSLNTYVMEGYGRRQTVTLPDEEKITNALFRLMESGVRKVYWLQGHGERDFKGQDPASFGSLVEALQKENIEVSPLNLARKDIPADAAMVVVAAPVKSLFPEEARSLERFLDGGGRLLLLLEPFQDGGLKSFLAEYGIVIGDDMVVDKFSRVMGGDYLLPMVNSYGPHEITKGFTLTSVFQTARSLEILDLKQKGIETACLAFTSPDSWAETDRAALNAGEVALEGGDRPGPLCLAAVVQLIPPAHENAAGPGKEDQAVGPSITGEGKMVVFGDGDFASNQLLGVAGNRDFVINAVRFLAGRADFITIERKHGDLAGLTLSRAQGRLVFWVPVVIIPLLVVAMGLFVGLRRRPR